MNYLYRWYKDGALLNGAVSAELEVTESGNYAVEVFAVLEKDGTIHSAGDTVLGADDISGILEILYGVQLVIDSGKPHKKN